MMKWIDKFETLPIDGKNCVVTDGKHIGYIIFSLGPRFFGDFDSANITHYMYPDSPAVQRWKENVNKGEEPDPEYEEFLRIESEEIDQLLAQQEAKDARHTDERIEDGKV